MPLKKAFAWVVLVDAVRVRERIGEAVGVAESTGVAEGGMLEWE